MDTTDRGRPAGAGGIVVSTQTRTACAGWIPATSSRFASPASAAGVSGPRDSIRSMQRRRDASFPSIARLSSASFGSRGCDCEAGGSRQRRGDGGGSGRRRRARRERGCGPRASGSHREEAPDLLEIDRPPRARGSRRGHSDPSPEAAVSAPPPDVPGLDSPGPPPLVTRSVTTWE